MSGIFYQDHGIRFEHPSDWEVDETDEGERITVSIQSPHGPAFILITIDEERPAPAELADDALQAMREEYPALDVSPAIETIGGHKAIGHDVEFFSLDLINDCQIRCFRTPRRTVMIFGQWSEAEGDEPEMVLRALRQSLEEVDGS